MQFTKARDLYFQILLEVLFEKYKFTERDFFVKRNNTMPVLFAYSRSIISTILKSKKYSLTKTGKIINLDHCTVLYYLKLHHKNISENTFGYAEMYNEILSEFNNRTQALHSKICHPCNINTKLDK